MTPLLCAAALYLFPQHGPNAEHICADIHRAAQRAAVDPALAVAVGYVETRWTDSTNKTSGCRGPMQVNRRYWGADGQTDTERGVLALAVLVEKYGVEAGLCRYAIGNDAPRRCGYARRVMKATRRLKWASG